MSGFQKIGLIVIFILALIYIKLAFFGDVELIQPNKIDKQQSENVLDNDIEKSSDDVDKNKNKNVKNKKTEFVNVFFIAHNAKGEEVYRAVKREYNSSYGTKIYFAVKTLIIGPNKNEKEHGVYTEVPSGTKLISLDETSSKITINLSSDFENGGGTDSLYKRLFQLIKTAKMNTNLPIYLQINGKQVDVIGGEGIMLTQPLSEDFEND
jgi:spore germination protein GerM